MGVGRVTFFIDVDNTLITEVDGDVRVNEDVRALVVSLKRLNCCNLVLWSGGGADYARHVARKFGIEHLFHNFLSKVKMADSINGITLDDQEITLGKMNMKLPGDITPTPWLGADDDKVRYQVTNCVTHGAQPLVHVPGLTSEPTCVRCV